VRYAVLDPKHAISPNRSQDRGFICKHQFVEYLLNVRLLSSIASHHLSITRVISVRYHLPSSYLHFNLENESISYPALARQCLRGKRVGIPDSGETQSLWSKITHHLSGRRCQRSESRS
jgi:hypothetical protein